MTCLSRAVSSLESSFHYHSDDHLARRLLPGFFRVLIHISLFRRFFVRILAPEGIYEYVIARTKYVDEAFKKALVDRFNQILLFGAGFDTRALRFHAEAQHVQIFELDAPITQQVKIQQYRRRNLTIPSNVVFIEIDFNKEPLSRKLDMAGFKKNRRSLFILEGVMMYLDPQPVQSTFQVIREFSGSGSRVVFDYIQASVLRHEHMLYGESGLAKTVSKAGEEWRFGIEPDEIASFAAKYDLVICDHKCAQELEATYFQDNHGQPVGRINGTHCIVTAAKQ